MLNILAGRTRSNGNLVVKADVRLNNYSVDPTNIEVRKKIAFVAQVRRRTLWESILVNYGTKL